MGEEGPEEHADRPEIHLFGGHGDSADWRRDACYQALGELIADGRERGVAHLGREVLDRLRALERQQTKRR